jgi:hypothetical protein
MECSKLEDYRTGPTRISHPREELKDETELQACRHCVSLDPSLGLLTFFSTLSFDLDIMVDTRSKAFLG